MMGHSYSIKSKFLKNGKCEGRVGGRLQRRRSWRSGKSVDRCSAAG